MKFFEKNVNKRSKQAMVNFLVSHPRYHYGSNHYSNNVKVQNLGLSKTQLDAAFDIVCNEVNHWDELDYLVEDFTNEHHGEYTIGVCGRSSGYLVLNSSRYELTGHKSYCTKCHQRNFKTTEEINGNKCGKCGANARVNYTTPPKQLRINNKSVHSDVDFEEMSMGQLRQAVNLITSFDRACDAIREEFIFMTENCKVVEEEITVKKTVKTLQRIHG
jgi:hypothetical protein